MIHTPNVRRQKDMNADAMVILSTIIIVAVVLIVCYMIDTRVKEYLKKYTEAHDSEETATIVSVASNVSSAFEAALKKSFNEAIADGVITREEALDIVSKTFTAVKDEFIKTSKDLINTEQEIKEAIEDDDD
jgi:hypothetical protein